MYKNQLQELAQRSCFNLPSYTCIREGPDHAPRFKARVNFNGETYESPNFCTTLRQAEHSVAEVALNKFACRGPSNSLAAKILDETGVYKNLLQEVSQRVGASLPTYTTVRSGLGHQPVFTCTVELAGCIFTGETAKNKKQAEKNAAMSAWSSLKLLSQQSGSSLLQKVNLEEQEHVVLARALQKFRLKARMSNIPFPIRFPAPKPRKLSVQKPPPTKSKILPLICPKTTHSKPHRTTLLDDAQTCTKTPRSNKPIASTGNDIHIPFKVALQNQFTVNKVHIPSKGAPQNQFTTNDSQSAENPSISRPHKFTTNDIHIPSKAALTTNEPTSQSAENPTTPQPHKFITNDIHIPFKEAPQNQFTTNEPTSQSVENPTAVQPHKFPAVGAAPYIPVRRLRNHHGIAQPVTIRNAIPVYSAAPPRPGPCIGVIVPLNQLPPQFKNSPPMCDGAPPVTKRQVVPVFPALKAPIKPVAILRPATNAVLVSSSIDEKGGDVPALWLRGKLELQI